MKLLSLLILFPFLTVLIQAQTEQTPVPDSSLEVYQPGDHELLFMPTAYTMPQNKGYFSDYELFLLNFSVAPSSRTHIGLFTLFPVVNSFLETITIGGKQNYYRSKMFSGAVFASYTFKPGLYTVGNVFSFGPRKTSFHAGLALTGSNEGDPEWLILLGGRYDFSGKVSGIVEYTNLSSLLDSDNFGGLLTFGVRFRGESISWEVAGVRPLADTGEMLLIPLLKATICF